MTEYELEQRALERRRQLAQAMMAQSMQQSGGTEYTGGPYSHAVRKSPLEGAARMMQSFAAQQQLQGIDQQERALMDRQREDIANAMSGFLQDTTPRPPSPEIPIPDEEAGGGPGRPAQPAFNPSAQDRLGAAMRLMSKVGNPADAAKLMVAQALKEPANPFGKVDPKDYTPESVQAFMANGAKNYSLLVPRRKVDVSGGTAYDPYATPPGSRVGMTGIEQELIAAGFQPGTPEFTNAMRLRIQKQVTHQPAPVTNVSVSTEKKYGEAFGGLIAQADTGMRDAAMKAPDLAERANRIKDVLASGRVITGAGADIRLSLGKALNLAGAGDKETIVNTETLVTSMAQNTLDAIKASGLGSGTGFSNADRDFLEKAVGGKITLEAGTIDRLANLAHRAAEKSAERWSTRVQSIPDSALQGTGISREPIKVPPLFAPKRRKDDRAPINPELENALKKYGGSGG